MTYTVSLTPSLRNLSTEGSMDTAIYNNASVQRSVYLDVYNNDKRKVVLVMDGGTFNDTIQTLADMPFLIAE